jgi:hypothetical protein
MREMSRRKPGLFAVLVTLAHFGLGAAAALAAPLVAPWVLPALQPLLVPQIDWANGMLRDYSKPIGDLVFLLSLGVMTAVLLARDGRWRGIGLNRRADWRNALLLCAALFGWVAARVGPTPEWTAAFFVFQAFTALAFWFIRDALFFGVIQRALLPAGALRAVVVAALLYAAPFFGEIVHGGPWMPVLARYGTHVLFGFGLGAVAWRFRTIWPLAIGQAMLVFIFRLDVTVITAAAAAAWGLYLMRHECLAGAKSFAAWLRQVARGDATPTVKLQWSGSEDVRFGA